VQHAFPPLTCAIIAHHIGNRSTQIFRAACDLKCLRRWCLTGTPIQNTLDNYGALLSFLRIPPFVEKSKFDHWISNPIREKRPHGLPKLRILVQVTCLRRTKQSIDHSHKLPSRTERIETVDLHPDDRELYEFFNATATRIASGSLQDEGNMRSADKNGRNNILPIINFLRFICNHGEDLLPAPAVEAWRLNQSGLVDSRITQFAGESCTLCHDNLHSPRGSPFCALCLLTGQDSEPTEMADSSRTESPQADTPGAPRRPSAKVEALIRNLGNEQVGNRKGSEARPVKR
jgi:SNF2 family DNA or RNA helicase